MVLVWRVPSFKIWRHAFWVSIELDFRGIDDSKCKNFNITGAGPIVIVLLSRFHTELQVFHDPQTLQQSGHRMWLRAVHQIFLALVKKLGTYTTYANCFQNNHPIFPKPQENHYLTYPFLTICRWLAPSWTFFFGQVRKFYSDSYAFPIKIIAYRHDLARSPPSPPSILSRKSHGNPGRATSNLHDEEYPKSLNPYCSRVPQEDFFQKKQPFGKIGVMKDGHFFGITGWCNYKV